MNNNDKVSIVCDVTRNKDDPNQVDIDVIIKPEFITIPVEPLYELLQAFDGPDYIKQVENLVKPIINPISILLLVYNIWHSQQEALYGAKKR